MPKRKRETKIERYQRKIKKLQAKENKRRRIIYTSSDESDNSG